MNDDHDPLEAELAALQPVPPSDNLRERLAERLSAACPMPAKPRWTGQRTTVGLAIAGGFIAASVAAALVLWQSSGPVREPELPAILSGLPVAAAFDDSLPSVGTYRRALGRSFEELDARLDHQAAVAPDSSLELAQIHGFTRFDSRMYSEPGEL